MHRTAPVVLALGCALATAACSSMSAPAPGATPAGAPCTAEAASWAIGRSASQELVNQVLRDTGSRTARVIEPGEVVTMDYNPARVSILVNERGAIDGIKCG